MVRAIPFSVCLSVAALVAGAANPLGQTDVDPAATRVVEQGQYFYSSHVSRVAEGDQMACMVSGGTDWKTTAQATTADGAPVSLETLATNTPYFAFMIDKHADVTLRIATGFAIRPSSLRIDGLPTRLADIEPRGDSFRISGSPAEALYRRFANGETIPVSARSKKTIPSQEHIVSYAFNADLDREALIDCLADLERGKPVRTAAVPSVNLVPVDLTPEEKQRFHGAACNRDLNLTRAEPMALRGETTGMVTPLGHALVLRDDEGFVTDVVSGDLWHLSQSADGYEITVSNSILQQSPFDAQSEKACTRMAAPRCATVYDEADGGMEMTECIGVFLSESMVVPGIAPWQQGPIGPIGLTPAAQGASSLPGGVGSAPGPGPFTFLPLILTGGSGSSSNGSGGSNSGQPTVTATGPTDPGGGGTGGGGTGGGTGGGGTGGGGTGGGGTGGGGTDPGVVPVPASLIFLMTALLGLGLMGRQRG